MELQDWWEGATPNGCLKESAKRLILFAPEAQPWDVVRGWNQTESAPPVTPGKGCEEVTMEKILTLIAKSFAPLATQ